MLPEGRVHILKTFKAQDNSNEFCIFMLHPCPHRCSELQKQKRTEALPNQLPALGATTATTSLTRTNTCNIRVSFRILESFPHRKLRSYTCTTYTLSSLEHSLHAKKHQNGNIKVTPLLYMMRKARAF